MGPEGVSALKEVRIRKVRWRTRRLGLGARGGGDLPGTRGNNKTWFILCYGIFLAVFDDSQDALLDFEALILSKVYMSERIIRRK